MTRGGSLLVEESPDDNLRPAALSRPGRGRREGLRRRPVATKWDLRRIRRGLGTYKRSHHYDSSSLQLDTPSWEVIVQFHHDEGMFPLLTPIHFKLLQMTHLLVPAFTPTVQCFFNFIVFSLPLQRFNQAKHVEWLAWSCLLLFHLKLLKSARDCRSECKPPNTWSMIMSFCSSTLSTPHNNIVL